MIFVLVSLTFSFSRRTCNRGKMIISKVPDAKCIRNPCLLPLLACLFLKPPSKSLSLSDPVNHQLVPPHPPVRFFYHHKPFLNLRKSKEELRLIFIFFQKECVSIQWLGLNKNLKPKLLLNTFECRIKLYFFFL